MAPLVDQGTDCEDELPTPACPPAVVDQQMDRDTAKGVHRRSFTPDDGHPCL